MYHEVMSDRLLKISEAAHQLGVTPQTLRNWEKTGQLASLRFHPKGNRMYRELDLSKLLNQFSQNLSAVQNWVEAQTAIEPPHNYYSKFRDHFSARLWKKDLEWKKICAPSVSRAA